MYLFPIIWFIVHSVLLITVIFIACYLYSIRDPIFVDQNITDYLWQKFTFYMWVLAGIAITYPLAIVWLIIGLIDYANKPQIAPTNNNNVRVDVPAKRPYQGNNVLIPATVDQNPVVPAVNTGFSYNY